MRPGIPPRSTKPIKRRGRRRFQRGDDPAYRALIQQIPCVLAHTGTCGGRVEAAHVKSKNAGGSDRGNLVPLCTDHHRLGPRAQHTIGWPAFAEEHGLDPVALAEHLALQLAPPDPEAAA